MVTDQNYTDRIKFFNKKMASAGLTSFYLLTKIDKGDADIIDEDGKAVSIFESDIVRSYIDKFCENTALNAGSVLPVASYVDEQQDQDPYRDYIFLKVLESTIRKGESRMEVEIENLSPNTIFIDSEFNPPKPPAARRIRVRPDEQSKNFFVPLPNTFDELLQFLRKKFNNEDIYGLYSETKDDLFTDSILEEDVQNNRFFWIAVRKESKEPDSSLEESTEGSKDIPGPKVVLQNLNKTVKVQLPLGNDLQDLLTRASKAFKQKIGQLWSADGQDVIDDIEVMADEGDGVIYTAVKQDKAQ